MLAALTKHTHTHTDFTTIEFIRPKPARHTTRIIIMDEGIHLPAPLQHHEDPHLHLNVVDTADSAVKEFKDKISDYYVDCSCLYEAAKKVYKEVNHNVNGGKLKVFQSELTLDQFDKDLHRLLHQQEAKWEKLKSEEAVMRKRMQALYQPVHDVELHVKDAKGDGSNAQQKELNRVFNLRLKRDFHDAKAGYDELCGYPDGLLTQIELLRKRTVSEVDEMVDKLRKRESSVFKVPAVLHKMIGA